MKLVYFKRNVDSGIHIHCGFYAKCFFVPDENVVISVEQSGSFGGLSYSLTDNSEILDEAKSIADGNVPEKKGVSYLDIKEFDDCDDYLVLELIENMRFKKDLDLKVKESFEELLKKIKS